MLFSVCVGAGLVPVQQVVVPNGIDSVNGSSSTMGCNDINVLDRFTFCGNPLDPLESLFTDGNIPIIDTSATNWASELITVKKVLYHDDQTLEYGDIGLDHVLLTFSFNKKQHIAAIYLDLLLCPEWNIGAPYITVIASNNLYLSFIYDVHNSDFISNYVPAMTTCHCNMSTIVIPVQSGEPAYPVWHILVTFAIDSYIEWFHVGEVRFSDVPIGRRIPHLDIFCTQQAIPGEPNA